MKTFLLAFTLWLQHLAVALWVGGLVALGPVSAPGIFRVARAEMGYDRGSWLGGALAGEGFRVFNYVTYGCAVVFLLSLLTYERLRQTDAPPRWKTVFSLKALLMVVMGSIALYLGTQMTPEMQDLRERAREPGKVFAGSVKVRFDALHVRYTKLSQVNLTLGVGLLFLMAMSQIQTNKRK